MSTAVGAGVGPAFARPIGDGAIRLGTVLTDADMEAPDILAWTMIQAVGTKQPPGHSGTQALRITATIGATTPQAAQNNLIVGRKYRGTAWLRSDGTQIPRIVNPGQPTLWTGIASTTWQRADVVFFATNAFISFVHSSPGAAGTEWIEVDDVS